MWFVEFEQKPGTSYHHRGHPAQSNISAGHYFPALVAHTFSVCLPPSGTSNGPGNGFFSFRFMAASNRSKTECGGDFTASATSDL
jgi:hypothetical protein